MLYLGTGMPSFPCLSCQVDIAIIHLVIFKRDGQNGILKLFGKLTGRSRNFDAEPMSIILSESQRSKANRDAKTNKLQNNKEIIIRPLLTAIQQQQVHATSTDSSESGTNVAKLDVREDHGRVRRLRLNLRRLPRCRRTAPTRNSRVSRRNISRVVTVKP